MPNIYEGELIDISNDVLERLPAVARTSGAAFVTVSNGHGAWEMAITNTLSRGDKVLVLESGRFATAWGEMAAFAGVKTEVLNAPDRGPVDPAAVEAHLRGDAGREIKAVFVVQVDTASSVINDIAAIRRAIDAADHPALLMVDGIASIGCERYEMDAWGVDVTVAASQKGLMVPPGLGFVWAGSRALAAHDQADLRTGYWDWTARLQEGAHYLRYCGTPPVSHLYGIHEALTLIDEEGGLDAVWERHAVLAAAVHAAVEAWSVPGGLELNITDPAARSNAVTTILTGTIDGERLRAGASELGLTLGVGIGAFEGQAFRIGHMGHLNPPMLLGTLGTTEAVLGAMGAPLGGSGVAAAAASIAAALSRF